MTQLSIYDTLREQKVDALLASKRLWDCVCFGWHMVTEADDEAEARRIGDANVDRFGGIRGVDHCRVRPATRDDVLDYMGMGGVV